MSEIQIKNVKIDDIEPYEDNAKKHPEKQIEKIADSIEEFGFNQPLVIDKDNNIVVGHGRYEAAIKLGMEEVPVIKRESLNKKQIKAYRLADNKLNESEWDKGLVVEELKSLDEDGFNIELTGFSKDLISEPEPEEDHVPELGASHEPEARDGDIYKLGDHTLMCGDSTESDDVSKLLGGKKADMLFTDPPYLMNFEGSMATGGEKAFNASHGGMMNDDLDDEEQEVFLDGFLENVKEHVSGAFYIFFYRLGIDQILEAVNRNGLKWRNLIIWHKNHHNLSNSDYQSIYEPIVYGWVDEHNFYGGRNKFDVIELKNADARGAKTMKNGEIRVKVGENYYKITETKKPKDKKVIDLDSKEKHKFILDDPEDDVWEIDRTKKNDKHPTMKPVELCEKGLINSSNRGERVLDLFGGSGSTLIACEKLERESAI